MGPGLALGEFVAAFVEKGRLLGAAPFDSSAYIRPPDITAAFRRRLEWIDDQIRARALRRSLPPPVLDPLAIDLDPEKQFNALGERFYDALSSHLKGLRRRSSFGFRMAQYLGYLVLLAILLFAVGEENTWYRLIGEPGAGNMARLLISMAHALFSAKGLAALGTYALLNLFLAFRFFAWYKKRLRRMRHGIIVSLKARLTEVWAEQLDAMLALLKAAEDNARARRTAFQAVQNR